jgi:hypothetical protein
MKGPKAAAAFARYLSNVVESMPTLMKVGEGISEYASAKKVMGLMAQLSGFGAGFAFTVEEGKALTQLRQL